MLSLVAVLAVVVKHSFTLREVHALDLDGDLEVRWPRVLVDGERRLMERLVDVKECGKNQKVVVGWIGFK